MKHMIERSGREFKVDLKKYANVVKTGNRKKAPRKKG